MVQSVCHLIRIYGINSNPDMMFKKSGQESTVRDANLSLGDHSSRVSSKILLQVFDK